MRLTPYRCREEGCEFVWYEPAEQCGGYNRPCPSCDSDIEPGETERMGGGQNRADLPFRRAGYTQKAYVGDQKIYHRTGEYEDGTLGEIFVEVEKQGMLIQSLMNCFCIAISLGLQWGVPLDKFVSQFTFQKFEPSGLVRSHPRIRMSQSIIDYIFRDLAIHYLDREDLGSVQPEVPGDRSDLDVGPPKMIPEPEPLPDPRDPEAIG